ncbi:hypothetical protein DERF_005844 [Dermatophagoides farinae]|uniref:Uncharacterized protein n=1 Tax=Dermatophagoides farinae TaxID=6954 RepID=A0A922I527_DERFA|nr:hypothetical protein DERF_005844 [Dermatophagoides farinae]
MYIIYGIKKKTKRNNHYHHHYQESNKNQKEKKNITSQSSYPIEDKVNDSNKNENKIDCENVNSRIK